MELEGENRGRWYKRNKKVMEKTNGKNGSEWKMSHHLRSNFKRWIATNRGEKKTKNNQKEAGEPERDEDTKHIKNNSNNLSAISLSATNPVSIIGTFVKWK